MLMACLQSNANLLVMLVEQSHSLAIALYLSGAPECVGQSMAYQRKECQMVGMALTDE